MGNTITSGCHAPSKGNLSFKSTSLHPNGNWAVATQKQKKGRKKHIRFIGSEKPLKQTESSYPDGEGKPFSKDSEAAATLSKLSNASGNNTDNAITSDTDSHGSSLIEDISDINSIFVFEKGIGDGKFSSVFLAHPRSEPKSSVAIKVISREAFHHRIHKEINLLRGLCHSNIIRFISAYKDKESFYIVTEYCEGGELFSKISTHSGVDELEACEIMSKLLSAVKYLHDRNIGHRDLKPENIMFKQKGSSFNIKLVDFGLSKQLTGDEKMKKRFGTPYYLAPEVLEQNYGKEVDMWSIGVITFVLLCGYPPFLGDDAAELFKSIYRVSYEFLEEDWCFISDEAKDFITKLLVKDPKKRMTVEQALNHPWIISGGNESITVQQEDEVNSSMSDVGRHQERKLELSKKNSLSKSAEGTTVDSYAKCFGKEGTFKDEPDF